MMNFLSSAFGKSSEDMDRSTCTPTPRTDEELIAEMERMKQEAYEACMADIGSCLTDYLAKKGTSGSYEGWISEMHPENLKHGRIDHRFYLIDSDHRLRWNAKVDRSRFVFALDPAGHVVAEHKNEDDDDAVNWAEWDFCEGYKAPPRQLPPRIIVAPAVRVFPKLPSSTIFNGQMHQAVPQAYTPPTSAHVPIRRVVVRSTQPYYPKPEGTFTTTSCGWTLVN